MKILIFALVLLLASCTTSINKPDLIYTCNVFELHDPLVKILIRASSIEIADEAAEKVRKNLVEKNLIPEGTFSMCFTDQEIKE